MAISIGLYRDSNGDLKGKNPLGQAGANGLATWPNSFTYAGAFRVPKDISNSGFAYSSGVIGLSASRATLFMSTENLGVAELAIPTLSLSSQVSDLNFATEVQGHKDVLGGGAINPDGNDHVSGIIEHDGKLIVTSGEAYDGSGTNTKFVSVISNAGDLANATVSDMYDIGGRYRAAGWVSPVPSEWQSQLGYSHIIGHSDNYSITSRASRGPSAFGINLNALTATTVSEPVPTEAFQDYPNPNHLALSVNIGYEYEKYDGSTVSNPVFTIMSEVGFGFIIPNTRTYACFGKLSGVQSGMVYDGGSSGWVLNDPSDWGFARWFFDLDDWIDVKNGLKQPHEVAPYEYGIITTLFDNVQPDSAEITIRGGAFDPASNKVYLTIEKADVQGLSPTPLVLAYNVGVQ